jgi:hypothetical protein
MVLTLGTITASAQTISLPEGAKAGECYARVMTAPKFETMTERVLRQEASERIEVIPATFETVTERVLVKAAGEKIIFVDEDGNPFTGDVKPVVRTLSDGTIEVTPTAYETVTERVQVREAYDRIETVPAVYETATERILVRPARTEWRASEGRIYGNAVADDKGQLITKSDVTTGELMCLVEIPAEYKTVTKRVLKTPATQRSITVPAEYKTVTKRVPKKLHTKTIRTEPVYENITKTVVKTQATERRIQIPAEYDTITRREQVQDSKVVWMPVLCEANVTTANVMEIQRALQRKGYNPGSVDGQLGPATITALTSFQQKEGLATGELTLATLKALGVSL